VRALGAKYGRLVEGRTLTFPIVAEIIDYYENDGESEAIREADAKVAEMQKRLSAAQGASGGLTRRINRLEKQLEEMSNIKANNAKLARISSFAAELVEYCDKDLNKHLDVKGDSLNENPLYVRLRAELGVDE
jgi:hypothetical protein